MKIYFFEHFSAAWTKLMELGVDFSRNPPKSVWEKLF